MSKRNPHITSLGCVASAFKYPFGFFGSRRYEIEREIYFDAEQRKQFLIERTCNEPNPLHKYAAPLYRLAESIRLKRGWEGLDKHGYSHKASLCENEDEIISLCKECYSQDIGERGSGDEYLTVCSDCQSVEQGYVYIHESEVDDYE